MATIQERLTLVDLFSENFTKFISYAEKSAASAENVQAALGDIAQASSAMASAVSGIYSYVQAQERAEQAAREAAEAAAEAEKKAWKYATAQKSTNSVMKQGATSAGNLAGKLQAVAGAYLGMQGVSLFVKTADMLTQSTARIDRMNDGLQTTEEVQEMIFQAAQRSRGSYSDMLDSVSKLGTMAGDAFSSTEEVVSFTEQLSKQFALAGTSAEGQAAAMLQLTQAMGSGVLRGEELNSVLEQAPNIVQTIAQYMGTTVAGVRELASEGKITADVVKDALFSVADETNQVFEDVPMTFSQAWTKASNQAIIAFQPAMERITDLLNSEIGQNAINGLIGAFEALGEVASYVVDLLADGAQWVADNWDTIMPVLVGLALGVGAVMVASAVSSMVAWAMANWPLLAVIGSITLIIYMAKQMGATWEEIGSVIGGVFMTLYANLMNNLLVPMQNKIAMFANFIGNVFTDPIASIKILFLDMADTVLGYIANIAHAIEDLINLIPGVEINVASKLDDFRNKIQSVSQEIKDESGWKEYVKKWDYVNYTDAWNQGASAGGSVGAWLDNFSLSDTMSSLMSGTGAGSLAAANAANLADIAADTSSIEKSVSMSEEDIQDLVDLATRDYINNINLTAQTPVITINGANTGNTAEDRQALANTLRDILVEQMAAGSIRSTARVG